MLTVRILHPDQVLFEGEAEYVLAPGRSGAIGIMPGHTPFFAELVPGELLVHGELERAFPVKSGVLKVRADAVTVLVAE